MNVPLIPRKVLFGNPDKASVQVSPDGSQIAYLAPLDGVLNVWVAPRDRLEDARPVTRDTNRGIRFYGWAYTNEHILYLQDKNGDENWRVYRVDLGTDQTTDLTPFENVQARLVEFSPRSPRSAVIGLNNRDARLHDLYRLDLISGGMTLLVQNEGFLDFLVDEDYQVRGAQRMTPDGGIEVFKSSPGGGWEPWDMIPQEDTLTTSPLGFDRTGAVLYLTDSRGRNTAAVVATNFDTKESTILADDPRSDAQGVLRHPTERTIQAVAFNYERKSWRVLDPAVEADLAYLRTVADGDVEVTSRSLDDRYWIVLYLVDAGPARFYLYDRQERSARFLFTNRKALEDQPLVKMHPVVIKSRDGLDLVSYYSLPPGSDSDGDGIPDRPLPMVFFPHGGPWGRDTWGYNPYHQWLANRGYATLNANFRSSTGFGKAFVNAGDKEWGGKIHEDQVDAVRWAIEVGIADPERVAVMGGSFGGYSTLAGLTLSPDLFACGVDLVGPSSLMTLLESMPPYWKPMLEMFASRVGDHRTEEGRALLVKHSPLTYVERIRRPLLIGQGANDPRVKQTESDQIVQAMQSKNIPVTYALYPDEGHGFARPENNLSFSAIAEAFLSRCLGGRFEPVGSDFENSSLQVRVGADQIPGLKEVMPS